MKDTDTLLLEEVYTKINEMNPYSAQFATHLDKNRTTFRHTPDGIFDKLSEIAERSSNFEWTIKGGSADGIYIQYDSNLNKFYVDYSTEYSEGSNEMFSPRQAEEMFNWIYERI
jgi:hypothetical protein